MAEDFGRLLLDAINTGVTNQQNAKKLGMAKDQQKLDEMARQQAHDLAVKHLEEQKRTFDANHALLAQQAAVKLQEAKQGLIEASLKGIPIPGAEVTPTAQGTGGASFSPANPQQATSQVLRLPQELGGEQITLPSPTQFAMQQANMSRITDAPKVEARLKEINLQGENQRVLESIKSANDAKDQFQKLLWEQSMHALDRESQERIAKGHDATNRFLAVQRNGIPEGWENYNLMPHIQDAMDGKLSREDFQRMQLPPVLKRGIEVGVKNAGGNFLDKKQQDDLVGFAPVLDVVNTMDQLLELLPKTESNGKFSSVQTTAAGLGEVFNKDIQSLRDRLEGQATLIGRSVSKDNRVSDQDAKRVGQGYFPSPYDNFKNNVAKRDDFVRKVSEAVDARLGSTVDPKQREMIKKRLGLTTIPQYNIKKLTDKTQQPNTNGVRTWTPDGSWMN